MVQEKLAEVNTYQEWLKSEGIPVIRGFFVADVNAVELSPWERKGGLGAFINLEGTGNTNDAYVCEIPPGASLKAQRHLFEELIYVLGGRGATTVWYDEGRKQTFEWKEGSLFSIPLNAWHQHFNGQGDRPARYLAVTNAPLMINLFHNLDFIFNNPFVFSDRYLGEEGYFSGEGKLYAGRIWESNFVPDVKEFQLLEWKERGAGGSNIMLELAQNTMAAHISEFPVGTYKKAHRHGPGAHVIILSGKGYSLLWPEGGERTRVDWKPGSMFVPPEQWFHQHFNVGPTPARYLALRWGSRKFQFISLLRTEGTDRSLKEGGRQIEYEDEDPEIHRIFEGELAREGVPCRMRSMVAWCTA